MSASASLAISILLACVVIQLFGIVWQLRRIADELERRK